MVMSYNFAGLSTASLQSLQAELGERLARPSYNVFFNRASVP